MRHALPLALALTALASPAPARESLVVCFADSAAQSLLEAAGFRFTGCFADGPHISTCGPFETDFSCVHEVQAPPGLAADSALARLRSHAGVEWAEPDVLYEVAARGEAPAPSRLARIGGPAAPPEPPHTANPPPLRSAAAFLPNDPFFRDGRQWALRNPGDGAYAGAEGVDIRAPEAWARTTGDARLLLAVLDTGVDPGHPDLQLEIPGLGTRLAFGINVTADGSASWADSLAHGTMVAGVMAALTHNGALWDSLGMAGVCGGDGAANPGCRVVPIKIAPGHSRYARSTDIARAILHATALGARALNLSFAASAPSVLVRQAMLHAVTRGCLVVCAAGNRGDEVPQRPQYPAAHAAQGLCLAVGGSDSFDRQAPWSSYGDWLDLVAPATDIWSTAPTYPNALGATFDGYAVWAGTSFAAPHATGAAGLLAAARPELLAEDLRQLLLMGARDIEAPGPDSTTGRGRLDAAAALDLVGDGIGIWHDEAAPREWLATGRDTLVVAEPGPGALADWVGRRYAERIELRARVAWPDSFVGVPRVWARLGGTFAVHGVFRLPYFTPWAEVVPGSVDAAGFTLRGYIYRALDGAEEEFAPLPPDQVRLAFTAVGPVRRLAVPGPARVAPPALRAGPNPFRESLRLRARGPGALEVLDAAGRRLRRWEIPPDETIVTWDGRDGRGLAVPPGIYWLRLAGAGREALRVVRLP